VADADLTVSDFDYVLPPDRIAQEPARPRDASRLLVLDRASGSLAHHRFHELPDLLAPGDLVVVNDTRVLPAAFTVRRATGARIEGLFLRVVAAGLWEVMLAGRGRLRMRDRLALVDAGGRPRAEIELMFRGEGGVWHVRPAAGADPLALLREVGRTPLPPYIRRAGAADPHAPADRDDYQTVYARRDGAVAAPTAGLHFTPQVLERLRERGIERVAITLHVGLGTFQPVRVERLADHRMHAEYVEIPPESAERINRARAEGRRIVAVGTTTVRALESAALRARPKDDVARLACPAVSLSDEATGGQAGRATSALRAGAFWTDLFIRPPHEFRAVDTMVTNFHLPRTTLLVLVSAFAGRERVLAAYAEAIRAGYRFYSYGDAMLIP
jgi:S-adenosylmethionine:tRNA ribosyltransferase-isomerase